MCYGEGVKVRDVLWRGGEGERCGMERGYGKWEMCYGEGVKVGDVLRKGKESKG